MSNKPTFLQRIKGWAKLPKKKKHSVAGSMTNAVIKKQELVPILKKTSPPPLKSILKNQNNNNNLEDIKLVVNQNFSNPKTLKAFKRNIMSDPQYLKDDSNRSTVENIINPVSKRKESSVGAKKRRFSSKESFKTNLEKLNDSVTDSSRKIAKSIVEDIENKLSANIFSRTPSVHSTDDGSQSSLNETIECNRNVKLINKEDTISLMNIFKNESSFIKCRQAAIKHFERLKRSKLTFWKQFSKTDLRCFKDNTDDVATSCSSEPNSLKVIMINKVEKYQSLCLLDVSKLSEGVNKVDQVKKNDKPAANLDMSNSSATIVKNKSSIIAVKTPSSTIISKPHKKK